MLRRLMNRKEANPKPNRILSHNFSDVVPYLVHIFNAFFKVNFTALKMFSNRSLLQGRETPVQFPVFDVCCCILPTRSKSYSFKVMMTTRRPLFIIYIIIFFTILFIFLLFQISIMMFRQFLQFSARIRSSIGNTRNRFFNWLFLYVLHLFAPPFPSLTEWLIYSCTLKYLNWHTSKVQRAGI